MVDGSRDKNQMDRRYTLNDFIFTTQISRLVFKDKSMTTGKLVLPRRKNLYRAEGVNRT